MLRHHMRVAGACKTCLSKIWLSTAERHVSSSTRSWLSTTVRQMSNAASSSHIRPETAQTDCMTDIGTRKIFTEEHDIFRRSVRRFIKDEVLPHVDEYEDAGIIPKEVWQKMGSVGMLGVNIAAEFGGVGGDFMSAAVPLEEVSYSNFSSLGGIAVHSDIVMPYICHYGTPQQIKHYIPEMTAGQIIGAIAMTEPGAGSDLQGIKTTAKQDGSDWIINGSKVFITNGSNSDVVIVVANTNSSAKTPAHGISLFIVPKGTEGFHVGRNLKKMGLKAGDTSELFFDNVRVPDDCLLGGLNKGFFCLMRDLPQERLLVSVIAVAHCEFMYEETRRYLKDRKAFGRSLMHLQTIQHKMAEMKTNICLARTFVDNCMVLHSDGLLDSQMASMAKYWCSDLQTQVADQCVQLHGGNGYMWDYPIARSFVDARAQPIYAGSNEIMKELIARSVIHD